MWRLLLLLVAVATSHAAVVYVKADATGTGSGASWANAHASLAAAIAASRSGDQLWIAAGTYHPGSSRSSTFIPKAGTTLYGGFRGTETALAQRSGDATLTVLSGDVGVAGTASDNANHVVWIQGDGSYALHDLTITGGYADGTAGTGDATAGGVFLTALLAMPLAADLTLENCRITGNQAGTSAAIHSLSTGAITLRRCLITGNRQVAGHNATGNIALFINGTLAMESCVVAGNAAEAASTYAKFDISSPATLTNCLFADNQAAGPYLGKDATLNACTLAGNRTLNLDRASNAIVFTANSIVMLPYQSGMSHVHSWWEGDTPGAVPGFLAAGNGPGADGVWLTSDDGYQLAAGSGLVDPVQTVALAYPAGDVRGLARPQGRVSDYGAYERDQGGQAPVAQSASVTGNEDQDLAIAVTGSDADSAILTGRILSLPSRGQLLPTLDGVAASGPALTAANLPFRIPDPQRRVLYRPPPDANGTAFASFTVDLDDGLHTSFPATITVYITAVDDPPTIDQPAAQQLLEDFSATLTLSGIGPGGGESQTVTVTATVADSSLFAPPQISYTSPAATATLTLVPVPDAFGATTVTVTVSDGVAQRQVTFTATLTAANDPPRLWVPASAIPLEDTPFTVGCVVWGAGPANEDEQIGGLLLFAASINPELVVVEGIDWTPGPRAEATLRLRPQPNATGLAQVVVSLIDDTRYGGDPLATSEILVVWISPVNDPPAVVRNLPIAVTRGGSAAVDRDHLLATDPDQQPEAALLFVLTAAPAHGDLEFDQAPLAPGGSFTMQDVSDGRISYRHRGGAPVGDLATLNLRDGVIGEPFPTLSLSFAVDGRAVPLVTIPGQGPAWAEGSPAVAVAATATVSDADDAALPGGSITVSVTGDDGSAVLALADQGVGAGQISIRGASVSYGGKALGTWSGGSAGTPLSIQLFVADATLEAVQAVVRAVTFRLAGGAPAAGARTVTVVVDDGSSGASAPAATAIAVVLRDDPPTVRTVRLGLPAGASVEFALAADDADSATLSWALAGQGGRFAASLVDAGRGRVRLTAPADSRGEDLLAVTVADGSSTVAASIPVLVTGPDDPRPLPAGEFPGEAFADEVLRVDIPWDCRLLPGARLAFAATPDAPAGLVLAATGATSVRATWAVPAGEPPGHRRFAIIASDTVSGASGALPVLLPVRPRPQGSN